MKTIIVCLIMIISTSAKADIAGSINEMWSNNNNVLAHCLVGMATGYQVKKISDKYELSFATELFLRAAAGYVVGRIIEEGDERVDPRDPWDYSAAAVGTVSFTTEEVSREIKDLTSYFWVKR